MRGCHLYNQISKAAKAPGSFWKKLHQQPNKPIPWFYKEIKCGRSKKGMFRYFLTLDFNAVHEHSLVLCIAGPKLFPAVQLLEDRDHCLSQDSKLARTFRHGSYKKSFGTFKNYFYSLATVARPLPKFPPGAWRTDPASTSAVWVTHICRSRTRSPIFSVV